MRIDVAVLSPDRHTQRILLAVTRRATGMSPALLLAPSPAITAGTPILVGARSQAEALQLVKVLGIDLEPFVFVGAPITSPEVAELLDIGAAEVVDGNADPRELGARIRQYLRGRATESTQRRAYESGGLRMDFVTLHCWANGSRVEFTHTEFAVLATLAIAAPHPLTAREVAAQVWGPTARSHAGSVTTYMYRIRAKLAAHGSALIAHRRGIGYSLPAMEMRPGRAERQTRRGSPARAPMPVRTIYRRTRGPRM